MLSIGGSMQFADAALLVAPTSGNSKGVHVSGGNLEEDTVGGGSVCGVCGTVPLNRVCQLAFDVKLQTDVVVPSPSDPAQTVVKQRAWRAVLSPSPKVTYGAVNHCDMSVCAHKLSWESVLSQNV
jgi:hypothetical protein